jgi:predicted nucleic acid-binding protein
MNAISMGNIVLGCPMVWHEVRRGLLARDAKAQMALFENLFATFQWQDYTRDDWSLAAEWWAQRRAAGQPIADADLLIAVFAHNRNAALVTDNEKDFADLGVNVENWRQS